jgi:hypothetical protein
VRRTTKNADHQTIPRFEQLVDLGFLQKPSDGNADRDNSLGARRRWRYVPTVAARLWAASRQQTLGKEPFLWNAFATPAVAAFSIGRSIDSARPRFLTVAHYLWQSYETVRRAVGHTPLDSVALVAMLLAAEDGIAIEMSEFHRLMLAIKQQSVLPAHAFFASGNDLDKMFIQLKPGFLEQLPVVLSQLPSMETR